MCTVVGGNVTESCRGNVRMAMWQSSGEAMWHYFGWPCQIVLGWQCDTVLEWSWEHSCDDHITQIRDSYVRQYWGGSVLSSRITWNISGQWGLKKNSWERLPLYIKRGMGKGLSRHWDFSFPFSPLNRFIWANNAWALQQLSCCNHEGHSIHWERQTNEKCPEPWCRAFWTGATAVGLPAPQFLLKWDNKCLTFMAHTYMHFLFLFIYIFYCIYTILLAEEAIEFTCRSKYYF